MSEVATSMGFVLTNFVFDCVAYTLDASASTVEPDRRVSLVAWHARANMGLWTHSGKERSLV